MGHLHPASEPATPTLDRIRAANAAAERELGAFLTAARQNFGPAAALHAADYWLEAFEAATAPVMTARDLRAITILATSRMAHHVLYSGTIA